ncbi:Uncharacterised protein [uncultured archaeon]|nr:Uncharacterised protein [uncultured archaeon]
MLNLTDAPGATSATTGLRSENPTITFWSRERDLYSPVALESTSVTMNSVSFDMLEIVNASSPGLQPTAPFAHNVTVIVSIVDLVDSLQKVCSASCIGSLWRLCVNVHPPPETAQPAAPAYLKSAYLGVISHPVITVNGWMMSQNGPPAAPLSGANWLVGVHVSPSTVHWMFDAAGYFELHLVHGQLSLVEHAYGCDEVEYEQMLYDIELDPDPNMLGSQLRVPVVEVS